MRLRDRAPQQQAPAAEHELSVLAAPYTKTSRARREAMIRALAKIDAEKIEGDVVECGVWRGGNIIIARKASPGRICWLYDTFKGMTEPTNVDRKRSGSAAHPLWKIKTAAGGWAAESLDQVRSYLAETGTLDEDKLRFVVGDVAETLAVKGNLPARIALLRLDTDWYESTKIELEVLYPRLVPGGVLIIDDYGHWLGARKAVDDYFRGRRIVLKQIDYTAVMVVKS